MNEGSVHINDVVVLFECHAMGDFDVGIIVGVGVPYPL